MAEPSQVDEEIDALYGLRPGEFVGARDALAKRLRAAGDRDAADAVRKLARPTVAAWAINAVVRGEPEWTQALVTAGRRLEEAQQALIEHGDREPWREATADQRESVDRLARLAEDLVREERGSVSTAVRDAIRETLHAASIDPEARAAVCAARLSHELRAVGLLGGDAAPAVGDKPKKRADAKARGTPDAKRRKGGDAQGGDAKARGDADAKRRADAERRAEAERRAAAEREAARREAEQAARDELAAAEQTLAAAQETADRTAAELDRAQEADRAAREALEAAQDAVETARTALDRALSNS